MSPTLGELAELTGARVVGERSRRIGAIRTLAAAGPGDLSFLTGAKYLEAARASRAGAILVGRETDGLAADQLVVDKPALALARLLAHFHPEVAGEPGVHPTAIVGAGATVDPRARLAPYVVVGARSTVAAGAVLHPHVVVGEDCRIGEGVVLHPHVVLYPRTVLGAGTVVHAGTVLGADGFGYATDAGVHHKIPQVGNVEVGAQVEIGALAAIDRALLGTTRVGDGTKIDNLVQVGHNVEIGRAAILCGQAGIAGSARLGDGVVLAGQAGVGGHLELGDGVQVASKSAVYETVAPRSAVAGIPAIAIGAWRRQQALLKRLAGLFRRVAALERATGIGGDGRSEEGPV